MLGVELIGCVEILLDTLEENAGPCSEADNNFDCWP